MGLSEFDKKNIICPICHSILENINSNLFCQSKNCGAIFPIIDGIPIVINESNSLFSIDDIKKGRNVVDERS